MQGKDIAPFSQRTSNKEYGPFYRGGQPGGPGCPVGILPISLQNSGGTTLQAELLDAGKDSTELELLRTVASRLGVRWGSDDLGWWAVVSGRGFPSWTVWRQDDSGSRFLMEANLTEEKARALVVDLKREATSRFIGAAMRRSPDTLPSRLGCTTI